jgi:hypothetical protein
VFIIKHHLQNLGSEENVSTFIKNILWWLGYGVDDRGFFQIACGAHPVCGAHPACGAHPVSYPLQTGEFFICTKAFGERSFVQRRGVYLDLNFVRLLVSCLIERRDDCIFYNVVADWWEIAVLLL